MADSKSPDEPVDPDASRIDFDSTAYQLAPDVVPSDVDTADDEHPVKQALGDDHGEEFIYDAKRQGERVAFRYESPAAALREYIANMETACIRTARRKLLEESDIPDSEIAEMEPWELLRTAEDEVGYQGEIYVQKSGMEAPMPDLLMQDNGIGISVEEYMIIQHVGLSKNHAEGNFAGEMGQGLMSGFNIVGKHGFFRFHTHSRLDGANYGEKLHIDRMKDIAGHRDDYGTTFEFPAMVEAMHEMDLREELEAICELVRVPVFYEEFNDAGERVTDAAEEFLPQRLDDLVDEDGPKVVYEDDLVMAVAAPELSGRGDPEPKTFMTCQPIERKDYGSTRTKGAPWKWHLWLKREDGPIWACDCEDADHSGMIPIQRPGYEALEDEAARARHVDISTIDMDDHVQMPDPVDDKDRLNSGFGKFYETVGDRLKEQYIQDAAEVYSQLAELGFDDLDQLDRDERALLFKSYGDFGPTSKNPNGSLVQEQLEKNLGVRLPEETASRLAASRQDADWARRERPASQVSRKKYRDQDHKISDVLEAAGEDGEVYMAKSISSTDKVRVAWELHPNNQVVVVGDYDYYEEEFGWTKLKDAFDLYTVAEDYPDLDDSFIENVERTRGSSSSSSSSRSVGTSSQDPTERYVKVRAGTGYGQYAESRGKEIKEALSGDEGQVKRKDRSYTLDSKYADRLLLYRQTEHPADAGKALVKPGIAYAVVPNYVYDYLVDVDRVYTDPAKLAADVIDGTTVVTLEMDGALVRPAITGPGIDDTPRASGEGPLPISSTEVSELTADDVVIAVDDMDQWRFLTIATGLHPELPAKVLRDRLAELAEQSEQIASADRVVFLTEDDINANWPAFQGDWHNDHRPDVYCDVVDEYPSVFNLTNASYHVPLEYGYLSTTGLKSFSELLLEYRYPPEQYPRDAPEWRNLGPRHVDDESGIRFLEQLEAGAPDGEPIFPSQRGDE